MSKVFVDQTCLRIILTTGVNVTGAKELRIHYKKPDGFMGYLPASVQDFATGIIFSDLDSDSDLLDQRGGWKFWSYVKFSDNRIARGESVGITIWDKEE